MNNIIITILLWFVKKMNFGRWLVAEELRGSIATSIKESPTTLYQKISDYIGYMINPIVNVLIEKMPWEYSIKLLILIFNKTKVNINIPMTRYQARVENEEEISWNYTGRMKHYLIHLLANSYGWDDTYIKSLDVETALSYVQEILVDEQLNREFVYSLSEIAYPYNKNTKKGEFKPLPRPVWMKKDIKEAKKIKMPKSLLPVGVVTDVSGMEKYFNENP